MLVDLRARNADFTGADAERAMEAAGIICNKNAILNDPRPPHWVERAFGVLSRIEDELRDLPPLRRFGNSLFVVARKR